jgi:hypothetical protein
MLNQINGVDWQVVRVLPLHKRNLPFFNSPQINASVCPISKQKVHRPARCAQIVSGTEFRPTTLKSLFDYLGEVKIECSGVGNGHLLSRGFG